MSENRYRDLLRDIKEALKELEHVTSFSEEEFISNRTLRYSARYSIVQIVEAAVDIGILILEKKYNESVRSYREVFEKLAYHGVISPVTSEEMQRLVSLRNMVVHRYWLVDDKRIYREAKYGGIEVVKRFIEEVERYVFKKD